MRAAVFSLSIATLLASTACTQQANAQRADTIYYNAKVITVDPGFDLAEAVATSGDKIVAVGSNDEIRKLAAASTTQIDLGGKTLMPGFYDNHIHLGGPLQPWKWGGMIDAIPEWLQGADTLPKLQAALAAKVAETPKGEWIVGEIAREEWPNSAIPNRYDLDKVAPDNPVAIGRGPHTLLVNSKALEAAGVTRDTKPEGGEILHDSRGEPTGKIMEAARRIITRVIPAEKQSRNKTPEQQLDDWHRLLEQLVSLGVTSVNVAGIRPDDVKQVQALYDRWGDGLPRMNTQLRLYPSYDVYDDPVGEGVRASIAELDAIGDPAKVFQHPKLKMSAIKMSIDGGLSAPVFWSTTPYANRPGYYGQQRIPAEAFYRVAKYGHEHGWQLGIHTMGDAAVVMVVDEMEKILKESPRADHRDYLHHIAAMPPEETLQKMGALGIGVASQPGFLQSLGSYADEALAGERKETQNPSRTLLNHNIRVSYGSDAGPYGPINAIFAAVTRVGWNGVVHGPGEAVTVKEALTMHTMEPAYFTFDEKTRGSIEPGKVADLVVLDGDPLTIAPDQLWTIKVDRTIIGGKEVYNRSTTASSR